MALNYPSSTTMSCRRCLAMCVGDFNSRADILAKTYLLEAFTNLESTVNIKVHH